MVLAKISETRFRNAIACVNGFEPLTLDVLSSLLFNLSVQGGKYTIADSSGILHTGIVESVQREDGSGLSFNLTMASGTFHVRIGSSSLVSESSAWEN